MKYNASFKLKVVRFAKASNSSAAARKFGVNEKQVREWKVEEKLIDIPRTKCAPRRGKQQSPELEEKLFEWVNENRECGYVITRKMTMKLKPQPSWRTGIHRKEPLVQRKILKDSKLFQFYIVF
ncbi:Pogo transposable element-like 91 [Homarus americanus]|uniref:Pogo transposable element-like 91 n=1 Tax=Homarus americanus TaxID=6706 RepID=A0A8J5J9S4_HOMAM|nr:Pogo transposable element-like 91 [Homarus americanus]